VVEEHFRLSVAHEDIDIDMFCFYDGTVCKTMIGVGKMVAREFAIITVPFRITASTRITEP
jgi:hypothetical protein